MAITVKSAILFLDMKVKRHTPGHNNKWGSRWGFAGGGIRPFLFAGYGNGSKNCRGIRDSNICGIRDWPQNDRGIRDSNTLRELDKVRNLFSIPEMAIFHLM